MSSYTIIIPSAKAANVARCVAAIREHRSLARIIVVADGIPAAERPALPGVEWIEGARPFCFARNINLGIRFCGGCRSHHRLRGRGRPGQHQGALVAAGNQRAEQERGDGGALDHADSVTVAFRAVAAPAGTTTRRRRTP